MTSLFKLIYFKPSAPVSSLYWELDTQWFVQWFVSLELLVQSLVSSSQTSLSPSRRPAEVRDVSELLSRRHVRQISSSIRRREQSHACFHLVFSSAADQRRRVIRWLEMFPLGHIESERWTWLKTIIFRSREAERSRSPRFRLFCVSLFPVFASWALGSCVLASCQFESARGGLRSRLTAGVRSPERTTSTDGGNNKLAPCARHHLFSVELETVHLLIRHFSKLPRGKALGI